MRLPIERKIWWGLEIAMAVLAILAVVASRVVTSFVATSGWVEHTHLVIQEIQDTYISLSEASASARSYLLTREEEYLATYNQATQRVRQNMAKLLSLTTDNPDQHQRLRKLQLQVDRDLGLLAEMVRVPEEASDRTALLKEWWHRSHQVMPEIRESTQRALDEEQHLLILRAAEWRHDLRLAILAAALLGLFNLALLVAVYIAFKRDLTERRRAEAALEASKERIRRMVESIKDYAIFMLDPSGRIATWNEGAGIIKGYEADEIIGCHFSIFYTEEDKQAGKPEKELEIATRQGRVEDEGWRLRKDGSRFWANVVISSVRDSAGRLVGFSKVTRDLTERRQTEEKIRLREAWLASILDNSPSAVYVKDSNGRYTLVSRKFEEAFRLTKEQVLGCDDFELFPPNTAQKLQEDDRKALAAGRPLEFEEVVPRSDGLHTYLSAKVPVLDEEGKPAGLCGVATDITERKRAEAEVQRLNQEFSARAVDRSVQLMQANEALSMEKAERQNAEEKEAATRRALRDVFSAIPVPMWTYDFETLTLQDANDAALALHGASRQEFLRFRMTDLYPAEDVSRLRQEFSQDPAVRPRARVWRLRSRDRHLREVLVLPRYIVWEGRASVLVIAVTEIGTSHPRDFANALKAAGHGV